MREITLPKETFAMLVTAVTNEGADWQFIPEKQGETKLPEHLEGKRVLTYRDVRYVEE